jgi:ankyrin repeat protein
MYVNAMYGEQGFFALYNACASGHLHVVELLLEQGADANAKKIDGFSSLFIASQKGHIHIVKFLLEQGADINAFGL